jgi:hypothetical protein
MSRWHLFLGNRRGADITSFVIQLTRMHQVKPPNRLAFRAPRPKAARQARPFLLKSLKSPLLRSFPTYAQPWPLSSVF